MTSKDPKKTIPFIKAFSTGKEKIYINQAIKSQWLSGDGPFAKKCEAWLTKNIGCQKALLTPSATAALEMAALLIGIKPGDEVIMPSYTFVSTANAFVIFGGKPVFVDIRPNTLNIDESLVEKAITKKTKAIVAVHYAGVGAEMATLRKIATRHKLYLIEDAAQGIGASYKNKSLGAWGDLAALSFHATKNSQCGEGGALLINKKNLAQKAEIFHEKGTNRSRFLRGEIDKYTWVEKGSSYQPSDLQAAYLLAQLEHSSAINKQRMDIWKSYEKFLRPYLPLNLFRLTQLPGHIQHNAHLFWLLFKNKKTATDFFNFMRGKGIEVSRHYVALHNSPAGKKYGLTASGMKQTIAAGTRLVRLPLWVGMKAGEIEIINKAIKTFLTT